MNDELSFQLPLKKTNKNTIYMWRVTQWNMLFLESTQSIEDNPLKSVPTEQSRQGQKKCD